MDSRQFIEEVKSSDLYYNDFEKEYSEFQEYQGQAMRALLAFKEVCDKNGIFYQLSWGSLLGAIRDNGQIPWDYDIDVFVAYCEKEKLIEALKQDLNKDFYFYCPEINKKCRHFFVRIAPKEYYTDVLHVDVFYLVGAPEDEAECRLFAKRLKELSILRYHKLVKCRRASMGHIVVFAKLLYAKLRYRKYSLSSIEKEFDDLCTKYDFEASKNLVTADTFSEQMIYPGDITRKTVDYQTVDGVFKIPVGYEELLEKIYTNYMFPLSLESRLNEMRGNYENLKKYAKI